MDQTLKSIVDFITNTGHALPPDAVIDRCRDSLVDALGCAINAKDCVAAQVARAFPAQPRGEEGAVIGQAQGAPLDIAAFWNTSMIRWPDFNDGLNSGHPSDMIGALVAVSRVAKASGADLLTAIAISYEVFARLHTLFVRQPMTLDQGYAIAIGATAGICHLLRLSPEQMAHAISFAATNGVPLRASRAGELSHYKAVATAVSSRHAVFSVHMARYGMTAPSAPFEGRHGIVELLNGQEGPLNLPAFDKWEMLKTRLKYFPVANNTQISIWAALELRKQLDYTQLDKVTLYTNWFLKHESASERAKWEPSTKETADHSLPYVFACGLRYGEVTLKSYAPEMINDAETRALMNKVSVEENEAFSAEWPETIQIKIEATDKSGKKYNVYVRNALGHNTNPLKREHIGSKFKGLVEPVLGRERAEAAFDVAWDTRKATSFASVLDALATD